MGLAPAARCRASLRIDAAAFVRRRSVEQVSEIGVEFGRKLCEILLVGKYDAVVGSNDGEGEGSLIGFEEPSCCKGYSLDMDPVGRFVQKVW